MGTVTNQIQNAAELISRNIELLADQRALLSQNVLAQLRNLIEVSQFFFIRARPTPSFGNRPAKSPTELQH